jgi:hypothetical protein
MSRAVLVVLYISADAIEFDFFLAILYTTEASLPDLQPA